MNRAPSPPPTLDANLRFLSLLPADRSYNIVDLD